MEQIKVTYDEVREILINKFEENQIHCQQGNWINFVNKNRRFK